MSSKSFTLLADGSSDRVLVSILGWMLAQKHPDHLWTGIRAELDRLPRPPADLAGRIQATIEYFPGDVIFVHRDAERESRDIRLREISDSIATTALAGGKWVPVIPVRMTEAWLLISEKAIREASGNPDGRVNLRLPPIREIEGIPDPKHLLRQLLLEAAEVTGRRRKKFHFPERRASIPDFIDDWSELLKLPSASKLYEDVARLPL